MNELHDKLKRWLEFIPDWWLNLIIAAGAGIFLAALLLPYKELKVLAALIFIL